MACDTLSTCPSWGAFAGERGLGKINVLKMSSMDDVLVRLSLASMNSSRPTAGMSTRESNLDVWSPACPSMTA